MNASLELELELRCTEKTGEKQQAHLAFESNLIGQKEANFKWFHRIECSLIAAKQYARNVYKSKGKAQINRNECIRFSRKTRKLSRCQFEICAIDANLNAHHEHESHQIESIKSANRSKRSIWLKPVWNQLNSIENQPKYRLIRVCCVLPSGAIACMSLLI